VLNLTASDNGTRKPTHVGDEVRVALAENPTTGYLWQAAVDPEVLRPVGDDFEAASNATGAGGTRQLTFEVVGSGTIELVLRKVRSWQPDEPADEYAVTLDVT
jgi:inhibitor of cysteine peptidase